MQLASSSTAAAMSMHVRTRSQEDQEDIALEERYPDTTLSSGFTTPLAKSTASSIHSTSYHQHEESLPLADTDTGYAEGGFGWVVTACTFVICFHSLGFIYAWGVIQAQIEHDKILSATTAAWLGGVLAFVNAAVCPLGHVIIEKFGPRNTCIASMSGMGVTLIATSFTFKYPVALFIFQGFLYGTCSAITFIATYCLPSTWFRRKRGFATGIVSAGAGLGGAVWSIVIQKAISTLGIGWAYRIMGLSVLVFCVPTATLLKTGVPVSRPTGQSLPAEQSLFRSGLFLRLLASCFIVAYPFFIPSFFLPSYAHSIGLSSSTGALLSAAYNLASGVGRIGFGILADTTTGNYQAFIIALLSVSLSTVLVWPFAISTAGVLGFAIWCGLGSGGFFSLQSSLVGQILGSHRVPQAIAVIESVSSIGFLIGPPTAGILLEAFGGISGGPDAFKPAMYLAGSATFLAVLLACSVRWSLEKRLWVKV